VLIAERNMLTSHVNHLTSERNHLTNDVKQLTSDSNIPSSDVNHLTSERNHLTNNKNIPTSHAGYLTGPKDAIVYICSIMEIKVEAYTDPYKQQVMDLIVPIQQEEFNIPITAADQPDLQQIPTFYQNNNGNFWLAINDGRVVGTISLLDIGNRQGALRKMFVHKDYRGKEHGTGQLLLNTLFSWAKEKAYTEIYLGTTAKFLAAHRFYEKNNFEEVTVAELPASFPRMEVDVKFYRYEVSAK
jgi:N-acetylglutamate synthase-like GNAT family acetyltransferase